MYRLADVDFSNRLGVVVSELPPEEVDSQEVVAKQSEPTTVSSADRGLEMAVFSAS